MLEVSAHRILIKSGPYYFASDFKHCGGNHLEDAKVFMMFLPTDFAAALANPIAYQSALEKHSQQLAVLEEDFETPVSMSYDTTDSAKSM